MEQRIFYTGGSSSAVAFAARELELRGIVFSDKPGPEVTHLLLNVPCREDVSQVLSTLADGTTIFGGMLHGQEFARFRSVDLLTDPMYLAQNAQITAQCAMTLAAQNLPITWDNCTVLIVGWGRIGKCLARLLRCAGADVSVAARNPADRAILTALGLTAEDPARLNQILCRYRLIINPVPEPILYGSQLRHCHPDCLMMELASRPGILSENVMKAPGLPGKMAPESSGRLIARTIMRLCAGKEGQQ